MKGKDTKTLITSGKRKTAVAKATTRKGTGKIIVNKIPLEIYQPDILKWKILEPLVIAGDDIWNSIDINVKVTGGGTVGQAEAARISIARALVDWTGDEKLREYFNEFDRPMLVGDPRRKESKKFGGPGARAKYTKSYR
ncbi:MAG: 30S ribosomal protein S9 [Candidatus Hodarchaeales archaeon]|jgi:small subunit ribosomal protein S9